jgi:hypothetical protein
MRRLRQGETVKKKAVILLAFACALTPATLVLAQEPLSSGGGVTTVPADPSPAPGARPASRELQVAYVSWRRKLRRHGVWHGRDLVAAARSTSASPSARELRGAIHRMQRRFARWLRSPEGRAARYRLKLDQIPAWGRNQLRSIAACESHNDPRAIGGGGAYRGLYQFSFSTWRVVGGTGDPAASPRSEQTWRAWLLLSRHGAGHWPVCG